jgi:hypothetical protein
MTRTELAVLKMTRELAELYVGGKRWPVFMAVLHGAHDIDRLKGTVQVSGLWLPAQFEIGGLGHRVVARVELRQEREVIDGTRTLKQLLRDGKKNKPSMTVLAVNSRGRVWLSQYRRKVQVRVTALQVQPTVSVDALHVPLPALKQACVQAAGFNGELRVTVKGKRRVVRLHVTEADTRKAVQLPRVRRARGVNDWREVARLYEEAKREGLPTTRYVAAGMQVTERNARKLVKRSKEEGFLKKPKARNKQRKKGGKV